MGLGYEGFYCSNVSNNTKSMLSWPMDILFKINIIVIAFVRKQTIEYDINYNQLCN